MSSPRRTRSQTAKNNASKVAQDLEDLVNEKVEEKIVGRQSSKTANKRKQSKTAAATSPRASSPKGGRKQSKTAAATSPRASSHKGGGKQSKTAASKKASKTKHAKKTKGKKGSKRHVGNGYIRRLVRVYTQHMETDKGSLVSLNCIVDGFINDVAVEINSLARNSKNVTALGRTARSAIISVLERNGVNHGETMRAVAKGENAVSKFAASKGGSKEHRISTSRRAGLYTSYRVIVNKLLKELTTSRCSLNAKLMVAGAVEHMLLEVLGGCEAMVRKEFKGVRLTHARLAFIVRGRASTTEHFHNNKKHAAYAHNHRAYGEEMEDKKHDDYKASVKSAAYVRWMRAYYLV